MKLVGPCFIHSPGEFTATCGMSLAGHNAANESFGRDEKFASFTVPSVVFGISLTASHLPLQSSSTPPKMSMEDLYTF